jgi:predicted nuclease with TOPRIM domain
LGNTEINDTLRRLDDLTKEEALAAVAQAIDEAHRARDEVSRVAGGVERVEREVSRIAGGVERVEREVEGIKNRVEGLEEGQMNDCLRYLDGEQTVSYESSM